MKNSPFLKLSTPTYIFANARVQAKIHIEVLETQKISSMFGQKLFSICGDWDFRKFKFFYLV